MKKEPVKVKELSADVRAEDFSEVVLGYSEQEALDEAGRAKVELKAMVWLPIAKAIGHSDVATTLRY